MATIVTDLHCDLTQNVKPQFLHGNLFSQDNAANTINVHVFNGGEPAALGGSISANVIRSDGATVAVSGAIDGNKAYIILPQACYAVPGVIKIIIKNTENTTVTTIAAVVANVYASSTDTVVDPGQIIPSVAALIAQIEAAVDSIPVDYSGLLATIASDYSSSKTYPIVGMYAWQGGVLKRNIVPITTAETYTAAHWTNAVIGDDLSALKSAFTNTQELDKAANETPLLWYKAKDVGVNSSTGEDATSSVFSATNYIDIRSFKKITYKRHFTTSSSITTGIAFYDANMTYISGVLGGKGASAYHYEDNTVPVPNNAVYVRCTVIRSNVEGFSISGFSGIAQRFTEIEGDFEMITEPGVNLFDVRQYDGISGITVNGNVINGALSAFAEKEIEITGGYKENQQYTIQLQACIESSASGVGLGVNVKYTDDSVDRIISFNRTQTSYAMKSATTASGKTVSVIRITFVTGQSDKWNVKDVQIEEGTIRTEYSDRIFSAVDSFARSRGNVLLPNGEDQTGDMLYRLLHYGCCNLGKGEFIVDNLVMPEGSVLSGYGDNSIIKLADVAHEFSLAEPKTSSSGIGYVRVFNKEDDGELPPGLYNIVVNVDTEYTGTTTSQILFLTSATYSSGNVFKTVNIGRGEDKSIQVYLSEPVGSIFCLSGHATSVTTQITANKFDMGIVQTAVIMSTGCTVENVSIVGADEPIELDGTIGNRNGIGWFNPSNKYGAVHNCRISDFEGAGILLQDTSTPVDHSILIDDCHISHNMVGIFFRKNAEYNKISNCGITKNYYGSLNRGGNNILTNCGFDQNVIGLQIDADEGDNNGHGSVSNCTLNHSDENTGYGLIIKGTGREMITGCQFYYSKIKLQSTSGNVINGCGFGNNAVIEVDAGSGNCNIIANNMFRAATGSIVNTSGILKLLNNWTRAGTEVVA